MGKDQFENVGKQVERGGGGGLFKYVDIVISAALI